MAKEPTDILSFGENSMRKKLNQLTAKIYMEMKTIFKQEKRMNEGKS